ncbi:MAG: hypothetical protein KGD58_16290 [Candidatus Lokiarchaeota archaeon]|nr:hypothetical protein [Candidatus Lokiarchaeota archaeon]
MLKLEGQETFVYIQEVKFIQCKYLLLTIPEANINYFAEIKSIDEAADLLDKSLEPEPDSQHQLQRNDTIPPEVEFWGHCSNLQAWTEMNYDTRLLHSNIAFPLLKKLTDVGDPKAKKVFKDEIGKKISGTHISPILFLVAEGYLDYLTEEEIISCLSSNDFSLFKSAYNAYRNSGSLDFEDFSKVDELHHMLAKYMIRPLEDMLIKAFKQNNFKGFELLMRMMGPLEDSDLCYIVKNRKLKFIKNLVNIFVNNEVDFFEVSYRVFELIDKFSSFKIENQLYKIIQEENPKAIETAIDIGLFQNIEYKKLEEIVINSFEPLLFSLIAIDESSDYQDGYLFSVEKIKEILFDYASENYSLVSSQLKRIFTKSIKNNYLRGLYYFFDSESPLGNTIKENDYDFFITIQRSQSPL